MNAKEVHSSLWFASYYQTFIPKFVQMTHCLHKLVGQTSKKTKKGKGQKKEKTVAELNQSEERIFEWHKNINDHLMHSKKP